MTIMRIPTIWILALTVMVPFQDILAVDALPSPTQPKRPDVAYVELPVVDRNGTRPDGIKCPSFSPDRPDEIEKTAVHRISFDQNGVIFWNGEEVVNDNLDEILKQNLIADGLTELQFYPSENTPAEAAINALKSVVGTEFPCFGFVNNEKYRKIWRSKTPHTQPWDLSSIDLSPSPQRNKSVPPIAIQVILTDSEGRAYHDLGFAGVSSTGRCRAFFGNKPVSSDELYDLGSKAMWNAVEQAGGAEKILNGEPGFPDLPDAVILVAPSTPWRCVGGVVFNMQISGFISIGFAVMPDSQ